MLQHAQLVIIHVANALMPQVLAAPSVIQLHFEPYQEQLVLAMLLIMTIQFIHVLLVNISVQHVLQQLAA